MGSVPPALDSGPDAGVLRLTVPLALPSADDESEQAALAAELGLDPAVVPTARRDEIALELEWALANEGTQVAQARLMLNGASEFARYDPTRVITNATDEDETPPSLLGGRPITVPAGSRVTGVFREDELGEAAQDLDAFARAGVGLELTLLTRWKSKDITNGSGALPALPSAAVAQLIELELAAVADRPLRLSAVLRIRDRSGRLRPTETDRSRLVTPSTTVFMKMATP